MHTKVVCIIYIYVCTMLIQQSNWAEEKKVSTLKEATVHSTFTKDLRCQIMLAFGKKKHNFDRQFIRVRYIYMYICIYKYIYIFDIVHNYTCLWIATMYYHPECTTQYGQTPGCFQSIFLFYKFFLTIFWWTFTFFLWQLLSTNKKKKLPRNFLEWKEFWKWEVAIKSQELPGVLTL